MVTQLNLESLQAPRKGVFKERPFLLKPLETEDMT